MEGLCGSGSHTSQRYRRSQREEASEDNRGKDPTKRCQAAPAANSARYLHGQHNEPGLLAYLSGHRFGRRLSRLDKTGGKAPAAVVGSPKEEDAALSVTDDCRHSGQEQEALADDRPQIPQV